MKKINKILENINSSIKTMNFEEEFDDDDDDESLEDDDLDELGLLEYDPFIIIETINRIYKILNINKSERLLTFNLIFDVLDNLIKTAYMDIELSRFERELNLII